MLEVKFRFLSSLLDITKVEEIILPIEKNSTVKDILEKLKIKFGKEFKNRIYSSSKGMNNYVLVSLNNKNIRFYKDLETKIKNGDEFTLLPVIAGG